MPARLICRLRDERPQALPGAREASGIDALGLQGLVESIKLRARRSRLGPRYLAEKARRHDASQQADDENHHQQFEQGEAARSIWERTTY